MTDEGETQAAPSSRERAMRVAGTWLAFLASWGAWLALGRRDLFNDSDTLWHLVVGRRILDRGSVPWTDEYSWTFEGRPWIAHSWLSEVLMAAVDRWAGGLDGVLWGATLLLGTLGAWIGTRWWRRGADPVLAIAGLAGMLLVSSNHFLARPHLFTLVLLAGVFGLLLDVEAGRRTLKSLAWLPPVVVVWANLHPGVLGGLGSIGFVFCGWCVASWAGRPSPVRQASDVGWLAAVFVASCVGLGVNPYGPALWGAWRTNLAMDLPNLIVEHARLDPRSLVGAAILSFAGAYVVLLLATPRGVWRATWVLPVLWGCLAASRVRHGALFGVTGVLAVAELLPLSRAAEWLVRRGWWRRDAGCNLEAPQWPHGAFGGGFALVVWACLGLTRSSHDAAPRWAAPPEAVRPVELTDAFPERARQPSGAIRVLNDFSLAGYVLYEFPGCRVVIDGRCELYGEPFLQAYRTAQRSPAEYREWRTRLEDCDLALVAVGGVAEVDLSSDPGWRLVQSASQASLWARAERRTNVDPRASTVP